MYEEHLIEVEALTNEIDILSTHNLILQKKLETMGSPCSQIEVSVPQSDISYLTRQEGMTCDEESLEPKCKSCLQKTCFIYRSFRTADMPYSFVTHRIPNLNDDSTLTSISSSSSLRSHYVKLPGPGKIFYTSKDIINHRIYTCVLDEMKKLLAKLEHYN